VLDEEQHIRAAKRHGIDVEEVRRQDGLGLGLQERPPGWLARRGARSMPASLRICHTVDAAILCPVRSAHRGCADITAHHRLRNAFDDLALTV
jgi:hypothetical protein